MQKDLKVSVCMITYDHEKYIREAIEGVLVQECDFEVELIVANDCSFDGTDKVIQDIIQNHPRGTWIKYFKHEKNLGMMPNFEFALKACEGKYIALCEGDDYWTDNLKLQKQVCFLEVNPDYVLCFHNSNLVDYEGKQMQESCMEIEYKRDLNSVELKKGANIVTSSVLFRNLVEIPNEFLKVFNGDTFFISLLGNYGKGKYLDSVMSSYRIHNGGVWSQRNKYLRIYPQINTFLYLKNYYKKKKDEEMVSFYYSQRFESGLKLLEESWKINKFTVVKTYLIVLLECEAIRSLNNFFILNNLFIVHVKNKLKKKNIFFE